jgi:hypothetical protein
VRSGPVRCTVPEAARVLDWQSGNHCRHFEFQQVSIEHAQAAPVAPAQGGSAKDRWNNLFSRD